MARVLEILHVRVLLLFVSGNLLFINRNICLGNFCIILFFRRQILNAVFNIHFTSIYFPIGSFQNPMELILHAHKVLKSIQCLVPLVFQWYTNGHNVNNVRPVPQSLRALWINHLALMQKFCACVLFQKAGLFDLKIGTIDSYQK